MLTAVGLIVAPFILPHLGFAPNTVNRILVWGLFGIGFDILFGYTGLLSFGQSAFYGTGGFVAAYLLTRAGFPNVLSGADHRHDRGRRGRLSGRTDRAAAHRHLLRHDHGGDRGGVLLRRVQSAVGLYRRRERPAGVPTPSFNLGFTTLHFTDGWSLYQFLAVCYFVGIVIALRIVRSPVGAILSAIRDNPLRAAAVGHNIHGYKLTAFVIAAAYAGFAGGLLGVLQAFMPPDAFTFETSGQLVMQTAIGGSGTLFGPLLGAAVWLFLQDFLQSALGLGAAWKLVLGTVFVLLVCFLRRGIIGGLEGSCTAFSPVRARSAAEATRSPGVTADFSESGRCRIATPAADAMPAQARTVIATAGRSCEASGLTKRYGGLVANSDIDFTVNHGELRGVIGPNGAGKSTFFKMLTCEIPPTSARSCSRAATSPARASPTSASSA